MKTEHIVVAGGALAAVTAGLYLATRKAEGACDRRYFYEKTKHLGQVEYTKDNSALLNEVYLNGKGDYRLIVYFNQIPLGVTPLGPDIPPERTWQDALAGWKTGYEETRELCELDNNWNTVRYPCVLQPIGEPPPPPTGCDASDFTHTGYDAEYDVTQTMNNQGHGGTWKLSVVRSNVISISGPYNSIPPPWAEDGLVAQWQLGFVLERVQCTDTGTHGKCTASGHCNDKWYWVKYGATLSQETPPPPPTGCDASDFTHTGYDAEYDVTQTMNNQGHGGTWKLSVVRSNVHSVEGPYDSIPPAKTAAEMVAAWQSGYVWERAQCTDAGTIGKCTASGHCNDKWYYVKYSATLGQPTVTVTINKSGIPIDEMYVLLLDPSQQKRLNPANPVFTMSSGRYLKYIEYHTTTGAGWQTKWVSQNIDANTTIAL